MVQGSLEDYYATTEMLYKMNSAEIKQGSLKDCYSSTEKLYILLSYCKLYLNGQY